MTSMIDECRIMLALFIGYKVEQLSGQRSLTKSELGVRQFAFNTFNVPVKSF